MKKRTLNPILTACFRCGTPLYGPHCPTCRRRKIRRQKTLEARRRRTG